MAIKLSWIFQSSEPDLAKQKKSVKINTEPILAPDTKEVDKIVYRNQILVKVKDK